MIKQIFPIVLAVALLFTSSCASVSQVFPTPLLLQSAKIAKSSNTGKTGTFIRPKFQRSKTRSLSPSMESFGYSDFEPLAPEEKKSAVVVAVILVLLIAASIAVPIITLTQL